MSTKPSKSIEGDAKKVKAVSVRSVSKDGFRRLGQQFTPDGTIFREGEITEEQFKTLTDERQLSVSIVEVDELPATAPKDQTKA